MKTKMPHKAPEKVFFTTREAAKILGICVRTAQLWSKSGLLDAWKTEGGHRRISRESIEKLLYKRNMMAELSLSSDESNAPRSKRLSILIVEKDPVILKLYLLKMANWSPAPEIVTVNNGFEALVRIGWDVPGLLVTDLNMAGGMDGFEMLKNLYAIPECSHLQTALVTELSQHDIDARGGLPRGVTLLPKPISFPALERLANSLVDAKKMY